MDQLEWARPRESYYAEISKCNLFHFLLQLSVRFVNNISISHSHLIFCEKLFFIQLFKGLSQSRFWHDVLCVTETEMSYFAHG